MKKALKLKFYINQQGKVEIEVDRKVSEKDCLFLLKNFVVNWEKGLKKMNKEKIINEKQNV